MTPRIPSLHPRDVQRVLERAGFEEMRQSGSHKVMVRQADNRTVVLPWHNRDLKRGTLRGIIRGAGLTPEEFLQLL